MTNATQTLAIIFAGTLVLALAASWGGGSSSTAAFRQKLLDVDTSAVQAVTLDRSDGPSIRLERADGGWSVLPSDTSARYLANSEAANDLLRRLPSLQVNTVTTRQPEKHPRYGVDSTGTMVTMLGADGETLGRLIVGRTQIPRRQPSDGGRRSMQQMKTPTPTSYVRPPDQPDVYGIKASLQSLATRTVEEWRRKQLWGVDRSQIQRIDLTFPDGRSFTAQRAAAGDTASTTAPDTWVSAGDTLSRGDMSAMLDVLSAPEADGFVEGTTPDEFGTADYTIQLHLSRQQSGSRRTLRLRPDTDQHYVATADGFPYVVQLRKSEWDNAVLRDRSALLKTE